MAKAVDVTRFKSIRERMLDVRSIVNRNKIPAVDFSGLDDLDAVPEMIVGRYDSLVRIAGYVKYKASKGHSKVLFRGQNSCFRNMSPSAFRANATIRDANVRSDALIRSFRESFKGFTRKPGLPDEAVEACAQHYGYKTRWLDVVDSVPHALFFACYRLSKRQVTTSRYTWRYIPNVDARFHLVNPPKPPVLGVVYVLQFDSVQPVNGKPGIWTSEDAVLCDLREALPSSALRPHVQHGMLAKPLARGDLWRHVALRVHVPVQVALEWINCPALNADGMVPDVSVDEHYHKLCEDEFQRVLLSNFAKENISCKQVGDVQIFEQSHHLYW